MLSDKNKPYRILESVSNNITHNGIITSYIYLIKK